ncbi:MAG: HAD-IIA family hydrolase [Ktedonobacteraceae bacterium]|nr:HAD-IIA family hydrolase [Ktedonobacteraceae bacterium]
MLSAYNTYLIDLDGVVYRGEEIIPGAREFVAWLNTHQKKYLFLTNNSFASETQVLEKLARLGIASDGSHVLGAGQAAIQNIARRFPGGNIYIVGEQPLFELTRSYKLRIANENKQTPDAVLVGLDRTFNYTTLTEAVQAVMAGAAFVAINRDSLLPIAGSLIPGCGAMVAAIEGASSIHPEVIGKPEPGLLWEGMRLLESKPDETIMIGDSLDTDILAGKAADTHTLFVLSGKDTRTTLAKASTKPEFTYENLAAVLADMSTTER